MFRFTIRDVLWFAVLLAVGAAWWLDHRFWVSEYTRLYDLKIDVPVSVIKETMPSETDEK